MMNNLFHNCYILIPARKGSKGLPFKNRKLFDYTANIIPEELRNKVFVSTDDNFIKDRTKYFNFNIIDRPNSISTDETSMKEVLEHFIETKNILDSSIIILLYLTYPERTWDDVENIYNYFLDKNATSLTCCEEIKQHPYLCFYERENGKVESLINHNLYRRQDYPKCVIQSMFVSCYRSNIINELHDLLFNKDTIFYKLKNHKIDVDYNKDINEYIKNKNNNLLV